MTDIIQIKNISFRYNNSKVNILSNIEAKIPDKSITLLLGSSGCGKSTMALSLTGIIPKSIEGRLSGDILYNNLSIKDKTPGELCEDIGILFQDPESQFCTFTVEDEIAFGLENLKYSKEYIDKKVDEVLSLVNMKDYRKALLSSLSGGEKQKIALCALLALNPKCLILDEPTANLDPKSTQEVFSLLKHLKEKQGKTIIIIEHSLDGLVDIVDKVILLSHEGKLLFQGSYREFIEERPELCRNFLPDIAVLSEKIKSIIPTFRLFYKESDGIEEILKNKFLFKNKSNEAAASSDKEIKVSIKDLSFSYDNSKKVIKDISINIYNEDFVAILGRNGSGKSTLSKLLLGLYKNYSGNIFIDNNNLKNIKHRELINKIGLVFQNPEHQFVENTVYKELSYSLRTQQIEKEKIEKTVLDHLRLFRLEGYNSHNPFLLSQGQKRRLSVASMLINGQDILILDEPTFGQDKKSSTALMEYMRGLNRQGKTIILITHDMELVSKYCSRAVVLNEGQSIYDGNIEELFLNDDVVEKGNLFLPPIPRMSKKLREIDSEIPFMINQEDFIRCLTGGSFK